MKKVLSTIKVLANARTRAFLTATVFFTLVGAPLIDVAARQTAVKSSAADQKTRQRADALLAQMTLDEKIGQMNQLFFFPFQPVESASPRPVRELKGFERVTLSKGETKTVRFKLGPEELRYWSAATKDWVQEAETFDVWVGGDSTASLRSTFKVTQ